MSSYYVKKGKSNKKRYIKLIGLVFILCGFSFFLYFFFPAFSYQLFLADATSSGNIETPIPKQLLVKNNNDLGGLIAQGINSLTTDFTDARNWYPQVSSETLAEVDVDKYTISIPKLKIENAEVSTKDYDLEKHLVQYLGTSIPGKNGTAVIFGHSTLPQLFDAKNYKTIFANAHTLKVGDEFFTNVSGVTYKYKIFSIVVTTPDDVNILSQSFDHSYITLVTCTPPGTIWKRLVVRASLDSVVN